MAILTSDVVVARPRDPGSQPSVEGVREVDAARGIRCQKGGRPRAFSYCVACPRFLDLVPPRGGAAFRIRCLWTGEDPVADLMTCASVLVAVSPREEVERADAIAVENEVRHLLVVDDGILVGVLCRCDLLPDARPGEVVADRMSTRVLAVPPEASLATAAAVMKDEGIGALAVVDGWHLLGMISRGDLRRVGFQEEALGAGCCAACGSRDGVRAHPAMGEVEFCLECLERAAGGAGDFDLGGGD
jgi:CBS domain-containing protein